MGKVSREVVIDRFRRVHGDLYDYSCFEYDGMHTKSVILCRIHGSFEQEPHSHLKGQGCPICGKLRRIEKKRDDNVKFIEKAKRVHGDKYGYDNVVYVSSKDYVSITCPKHGEFIQKPNDHLNGRGCPRCYDERRSEVNRKDFSKFLEEMKSLYEDRYDFSDYNYVNVRKKGVLSCQKHGVFYRSPTELSNGKHCPLCMKEERDKKRMGLYGDKFVEKAIMIHGDRYIYDKVAYVDAVTPVEIICKKHGSFFQKPSYHLDGNGCQRCASELLCSRYEGELCDFLKLCGVSFVENDRKTLNGFELDILVEEKGVAIEFDGLYWHSEMKKDKNYHVEKTRKCNEVGIRLIHIFEDEWLYKQEIVKSRLMNILGLTNNRIYARSCEIRNVSYNESKIFLEQNHIQGNCLSKVRYGLYHDDELVSLMTFGKRRINLGGKKKEEGDFELLRFCNKNGYTVVGGASRLLKYFIGKFKPLSIISYADRRWSDGKLYETLGFKHLRDSKPSYFYVIGDKRFNRFNFRKDVLVKEGFDKNKTEHEIMLERGIYRIYDCGSKVYEIRKC